MKNLSFTLILLFVVALAYSQTNLNELEMRTGIWYKKDSKEPFNGDFIEYFPNGKLMGKGSMLDGKTHGQRLTYFENGVVKTSKTCNKGVVEGLYQEYYQSSKLKTDA